MATVAVRAPMGELVTRPGIERLFAPVMEPKAASARVATKAGLVLEGIAPSHYVKQGGRIDGLSFGATRQQWLSS